MFDPHIHFESPSLRLSWPESASNVKTANIDTITCVKTVDYSRKLCCILELCHERLMQWHIGLRNSSSSQHRLRVWKFYYWRRLQWTALCDVFHSGAKSIECLLRRNYHSSFIYTFIMQLCEDSGTVVHCSVGQLSLVCLYTAGRQRFTAVPQPSDLEGCGCA